MPACFCSRTRSFDRVLAVECIFNFPSRRRFFVEARRVLRDGGRLTLSDFTAVRATRPTPDGARLAQRVAQAFGPTTPFPTMAQYRDAARETGFELVFSDDITAGVAPSFEPVQRMMQRAGRDDIAWATGMIGSHVREGLSRYVILSFEATGETTRRRSSA